MVFMPFAFAASMAFRILPELPEVDRPNRTSPFAPTAST
ncbi:Uncharacterised protein [Vibrio cholerae]|nr:Uncharacterised protein [Vibrio cholerae]